MQNYKTQETIVKLFYYYVVLHRIIDVASIENFQDRFVQMADITIMLARNLDAHSNLYISMLKGNLTEHEAFYLLERYAVLYLTTCTSHGHSHEVFSGQHHSHDEPSEPPSFKYSKSANEIYESQKDT
ncbi:hypothetical protein NQ317_009313 [Molorchus minor]|uniref:Uncharacterized protein n=1 Tax=Molorchus minor TaxID=1323400 RepID=A0ABQ9J7V9_9CUCU|nr:hypothetical protein NQ317_009313 [Molorchus minor]